MPRLLRLFCLKLALMIPLVGCVTLPSDFKDPGVTVVSVKPTLVNSIAPQFDILLRVTNPNRVDLDLAGLSYNIFLSGNKLIEGVASDLPLIPAYGEGEVRLQATADLLSSLRLLSGVLADPAAPIDFEFNAEIDLGSFYPMINVRKVGVISF